MLWFGARRCVDGNFGEDYSLMDCYVENVLFPMATFFSRAGEVTAIITSDEFVCEDVSQ